MEKLLNYLICQRNERAAKVNEYARACEDLEAAKKKVEAFGDMSSVLEDIKELDGYIEQVSTSIGAVEPEEVASDGEVTVEEA